MAQVQQRVLSGLLALSILTAGPAGARKFYPDDPLWEMPPPLDAGDAKPRKLDMYFDYFYMTFSKPGQQLKPVAAGAVNTLGEVPDSAWFVNRHGRRRMSIEELVRGAGSSRPPSPEGQWTVVAAKTEGVTAGFTIQDGNGRRYQIKFDTPANYEVSTGADVMGSKFYHAFGYYTPQNYIAYFTPDRLTVKPGTRFVDKHGIERDMHNEDIGEILERVPRDSQGRLRAVASLYLEGKPLGPFRFHGLRADDPNDIVPHENRRDLRGLKVFNAWLNHSDSKSLNSLDMLVREGGLNYIRHHLIDFSAAFGAEAFAPKSPRSGHVYLLDWPDAAKTFLTFGLYMPRWIRADYQHVRGVGRMESEVFDPVRWKGNYWNPAFTSALPDDAFWAAKIVMRFTEDEIRALVETAQFSDRQAADHLVQVLLRRQRKIGETYFRLVLPLDNFRVESGKLDFEDLAATYGFESKSRDYRVSWATLDNETGSRTAIDAASGFTLPSLKAEWLAADISADDTGRKVTVYVRNRGRRPEVVGIERDWPRHATLIETARLIRGF